MPRPSTALAIRIARHWLAIFNLVLAVFIGLPFLAPVLMEAGATRPARLIYTVYAPTCHQLPERSFFLFGPQGTYRATDLEAMGALPAGINILQREALRFIGTPATGYKVAVCERDVAIYGSLLLAGLLFGALRGRARARGRNLPKMPVWLYGLLLVPMAVDGLTQLFGLRESNWLLRLITGAIFGAATVLLAYPYVQEAMDGRGAHVGAGMRRTGRASVRGANEIGARHPRTRSSRAWPLKLDKNRRLRYSLAQCN